MSRNDTSLREAWERQAKEWIAWASTPGHDHYFWRFNLPQFLTLLPSPGRRTVDVGCGEGRLPRELRRLGHNVVGIDSSATLVRAAVRQEPGPYAVGDAKQLPLASECADLVIAFMSLHDLDDMTAAVREVARILTVGGVFCVALVHPLTSAGNFETGDVDSPFVISDSYLEPRSLSARFERDGLAMTFDSQHRPIGAYMNALEQAGFVVDAFREITPDDEHVRDIPNIAKRMRIPLFLHLRAARAS